jgi:polar amino acid transport system permease protein
MYTWSWGEMSLYKSVFVEGALITLELTLFAVLLGTAIGIFIAFLKQSKISVLSFLGSVYIEFFRALPILVVIIWIFYVFPILFDWRISPFFSAGLALALHLSAFVAETVRAAIESVPVGQFESGLALGMSRGQTMIHIVLPQAIRNMIPNMLGLYINELKNSSLASVIAVNELLHRANILISQTFRPLEIYTIVALVYLIIIIPLILLARFAEKRLSKKSVSIFDKEYEAGY